MEEAEKRTIEHGKRMREASALAICNKRNAAS
jgi:hypothetical protein